MVLFTAWLKSLNIFSSVRRTHFLKQILISYGRGVYSLMRYFSFLIALDVAWTYLMGDVLIKLKISPSEVLGNFQNIAIPSMFLIGTMIWFFLKAVFFLALCFNSSAFDDQYYKKGLLYYTHLLMFFSGMFFLCIIILAHFGIYKYPELPSLVQVVLKLLGFVILFFWLDSPLTFSDVLKSIEKGINFFLYNVPFFLLLIAFAYLFYFFLVQASVSLGLLGWIDAVPLLNEGLKQNMVQVRSDSLTIFQVLYSKYLKFFFNYFIVAILFIFYSFRKRNIYAESLFE